MTQNLRQPRKCSECNFIKIKTVFSWKQNPLLSNLIQSNLSHQFKMPFGEPDPIIYCHTCMPKPVWLIMLESQYPFPPRRRYIAGIWRKAVQPVHKFQYVKLLSPARSEIEVYGSWIYLKALGLISQRVRTSPRRHSKHSCCALQGWSLFRIQILKENKKQKLLHFQSYL